jgi:hypothetical protein
MDADTLGTIKRLEEHMDKRFDRIEQMNDKSLEKIEDIKLETVKQQEQINKNTKDIDNNFLQHKDFYDRLRKVEIKLALYAGGIAVLSILINVVIKFIK